jgi:hypothetical protein
LRQANLLRRQNIDEEQKKKELEELLKTDIRKELENYITYCQSTSVESLINENPTELRIGEMVEEAKLMKEGLLLPKVNLGHPVYAAPRFDVLVWWRSIGKSVYSKLALGAAIMLGKPAHNGYQERVFSMGKYCDNNLRNRLRKENFEMRVLDTVNKYNEGIKNFTNMVKSPNASKFVTDFFSRENLYGVLRRENDIDSDDKDNCKESPEQKKARLDELAKKQLDENDVDDGSLDPEIEKLNKMCDSSTSNFTDDNDASDYSD